MARESDNEPGVAMEIGEDMRKFSKKICVREGYGKNMAMELHGGRYEKSVAMKKKI